MDKEEARAKRIVLGHVDIPEDKKNWAKWVDPSGDIFAQPFARPVLSEEEKAQRAAARKERLKAERLTKRKARLEAELAKLS